MCVVVVVLIYFVENIPIFPGSKFFYVYYVSLCLHVPDECCFVVLDLVSSVLAKRPAVKSISKMTNFVLIWDVKPNSVNQSPMKNLFP